MHPNPLLDPLFWEHVVAHQRELSASRTSAALRCRGGRRWIPRAGGTDANGGGSQERGTGALESCKCDRASQW